MQLKKLVATLGLVGSMAASGYAWAVTYYIEMAYYSDASYAVMVGERTVFCNGRTSIEGVITPYRRMVYQQPCWTEHPW